MASTPIFQPTPIARSMPVPDAARTNAATEIARGVEQVGGAVFDAGMRHEATQDRIVELQREKARMEQTTDFGVKFAQARERIAKADADSRINAPDGGAGFHDSLVETTRAELQPLLDGIQDPEVRNRAIVQVAQYTGEVSANAYQYQSALAAKKVSTDFGSMRDASANLIYGSDDDKAIGGEASRVFMSIDSLPAGDHVKEALKRDYRAKATSAAIEGALSRGNVERARDLLGRDTTTTSISPDELNSLTLRATAVERQIQASTRADAAQAKQAGKETLDTQKAMLETGAGQPEDWGKLAAGYAAIGDTSTAVTMRAKGTAMQATIAYRDRTLPEMDTRISALTAKRNGAGLSPAEASELNGLSDLRSQSKARLDGPGGAFAQYLFASGKTIAPLDPGNAQGMAERGRQALAASRTYGQVSVQPILETELPAFKQMMEGGPTAKLQALQAIQGFGTPAAIAGAARQIAGPADGDFRVAATLSPRVARDVIRGADVKPGAHAWSDQRAATDFGGWYGRILGDLPNGYREDVIRAAKNYYLARMSDNGGGTYNPGLFAQSIETVLGRTPDGKGGTVRTTGDRLILVPSWTKGDAMLRTFARASGEEYHDAADGRAPRWSDGSAMTRGQFRSLTPRAVGGGRYGFLGPGNRLIEDDQGKPYTVDFAKLPQR